jgi:hypothetical protein
MLDRLHYLALKREDFAFETTLSSRTFTSWIADLQKTVYDFHLVFLWLLSDEFAVARVHERVLMGGHNVPEETVRRRYGVGLRNFFRLYKPHLQIKTGFLFRGNFIEYGYLLLVSNRRRCSQVLLRMFRS